MKGIGAAKASPKVVRDNLKTLHNSSGGSDDTQKKIISKGKAKINPLLLKMVSSIKTA